MWTVKDIDGITILFTLPNPGNSEIPVQYTSTSKNVILTDGSIARVTPQIKALNNPIKFEITEASFKLANETNIKGLIDNNTEVNLISHDGMTFLGWFRNCVKTYKLSGKNQRFSLAVDFELE